jgi:hypothetical protein
VGGPAEFEVCINIGVQENKTAIEIMTGYFQEIF